MAFAPDGASVAVGSDGGDVLVLSLAAAGKEIAALRGAHRDRVSAVALADAGRLAAAAHDGVVTRAGGPDGVVQSAPLSEAVCALLPLGDAGRFVAATLDGVVAVLDV